MVSDGKLTVSELWHLATITFVPPQLLFAVKYLQLHEELTQIAYFPRLSASNYWSFKPHVHMKRPMKSPVAF